MRILFLLFSFVVFGQQTQKVDFISLDALVKPNFQEKSITGSCIYKFNVKSTIDTIQIDAIKMKISEVFINGKSVKFKNTGKTLNLFEGYKKGSNTISFSYAAQPKQALYFVGAPLSLTNQIWTQGQGKYTSHWLPSFDDVNEKVVFNISVEYRNDYEVISNGILKNVRLSGVGRQFENLEIRNGKAHVFLFSNACHWKIR